MIKLTRGKNRSIYINPNWIIGFARDEGDDETEMWTAETEDSFHVDQTPEEIIKLMESD